MDFLINDIDISVVGQACFTCNCRQSTSPCYQNIGCPTHCWGNQICNPRMDPFMLK